MNARIVAVVQARTSSQGFPHKVLADVEGLPNAEIGGTVVMWKWIGTDAATTFSY